MLIIAHDFRAPDRSGASAARRGRVAAWAVRQNACRSAAGSHSASEGAAERGHRQATAKQRNSETAKQRNSETG